MKRSHILILCLTPIFSAAFLFPSRNPVSNISTTQTPAPTPTLEETIETVPQDFKNECDSNSIKLRSFSPQEDWEAFQCKRDGQQILDITNKDGSNRVLLYTDYLAEQDLKYGIPMGNLFPIFWTADGKSLYFSSYVANDGGGVCLYGFGDAGLWKVELGTGKISAILPVRSSQEGYILSFSPDGRYLAYILSQPVVRNLETGTEYNLSVKGDRSGNLAWANGSKNLYFVSCTIDVALQQEKETTLYKYSLSDKKLSIVFKDNGLLTIESFDGDKKLVANLYSPEGSKMIEIDPVTGKSQVITPVP